MNQFISIDIYMKNIHEKEKKLTDILQKLKEINIQDSKETDEWALSQGYVSVVPISFDMTSHKDIDKLKNWNLN